MLELLLLCAAAAVVLYKLKTVIGTRTGYEPPRQPAVRRHPDETVPTGLPVEPDEPEDEIVPAGEGDVLARIRAAEPGFSLNEFLDGARGAYEMILMAYEEGDRKTLQALLAPNVFDAFQQGISAREAEGLTVEARFIGVRDTKVEHVEFDEVSRVADISIRFIGELITAVRDAENRVVEGDPNEIRRQVDVWTFSREMGATDPNWLLTATGD